jgi:phospholipid/cholesterol/gamma-HCH transport system permease protein
MMRAAMSGASFTKAHDGDVLRLSGQVRLADGAAVSAEVRAAVGSPPGRLRIDLSGVERIDGGSAALLLALRAEAIARGGEVELEGASGDVQQMLALYECPVDHTCLVAAPRRRGILDQIGAAGIDVLRAVREVFGFIGDLALAVVAALREPRTVHWRDVGRLMERTGADGVPIVLVINFLVGLVSALQAAIQLKKFGANIFVADLVGLSMARELGPLMTAIIVAGRSGAAFAAELGTMRVSEEVDALRTLGLDPQRFLVFPRVIALALVVPLLTLLADIVGCVGGLIVAMHSLDLTPVAYLNRLIEAVRPIDVFGGLCKSGVFAMAITFIACQRGLATRGGAAGVGASTTSAVVATLFAIVLLDAVLTQMFTLMGI